MQEPRSGSTAAPCHFPAILMVDAADATLAPGEAIAPAGDGVASGAALVAIGRLLSIGGDVLACWAERKNLGAKKIRASAKGTIQALRLFGFIGGGLLSLVCSGGHALLCATIRRRERQRMSRNVRRDGFYLVLR